MAAPRGVIIRIAGMEKRIPSSVREALLIRAATTAIGMIRIRTRRGVSVDGQPFARYSNSYAKRRADAGRKTTPVDLTLTGHMLGSLSILRRSPRVVIVGFRGSAPEGRIVSRRRALPGRGGGAGITKAVRPGPRSISNASKARWAQVGTTKAPARPLVGVTQAEHKQIVTEVVRALRLRPG